MSDKRNIRSSEENLHIRAKQAEEAIEKMGGISPKKEERVEGAQPAKSFWSTGRKCPQCAHRLTIFELNEDSGYLHVECKNCGGRWAHPDLETPESDFKFRHIPMDVKQRWMDARERELKKKGLW